MTSTIGDLTFYMMDGVNYVRIKSSLTRKRVLKSPDFRKTRLYAGFMARASKIGSVIYQALPHDWRQGWMYRAFTGEALQLLKKANHKTGEFPLGWRTATRRSLIAKQVPRCSTKIPLHRSSYCWYAFEIDRAIPTWRRLSGGPCVISSCAGCSRGNYGHLLFLPP